MLCLLSTGVVSADMAAAAVISNQVSLPDRLTSAYFGLFCSCFVEGKKAVFDPLKVKKRH